MRLPYRNKKATLWVMFGIVVVTMFLFKFTELRPMCFFRDESLASASASASASGGSQSGVMLRDEVSTRNLFSPSSYAFFMYYCKLKSLWSICSSFMNSN